MRISPRAWLISLLLTSALACTWGLGLYSFNSRDIPIRIGVLHSLTGTMAANESPLVDAVRLAVEEINAAGGLNHRPIEMLIADTQSDADLAGKLAEQLITQQKVSALFGCWTSTCRQAVKPIVEKHNHLLLYPLQYEGMEQSSNIFYLGALPNQQLIPATRWALDSLGKSVYLIGSDYIYPHTANLIIRELIKTTNARLLAERYKALGHADFSDITAELHQLKPDLIINTINGDSNLHFFRALHDAGLEAIPVMSFSVSEVGLQNTEPAVFHPNHYAAWSYFMTLPGDANMRFIQAFRNRYGPDRVTSAPIATAYTAVKLWAQAVVDSDTDEPSQINLTMRQQSIASPLGLVTLDSRTRHLWQPCFVGKALANQQFQLIWKTSEFLRPTVYPEFLSVAEWQQLLSQ